MPIDPLLANCFPRNDPAMSASFRTALLWHMERHATTIAALAAGSQVSADTIKKLRTREAASTKAEAASRIAGFYGKSVADFLRCEDGDNPSARLAALIDQLTHEEADLVARQIRGLISSRAS